MINTHKLTLCRQTMLLQLIKQMSEANNRRLHSADRPPPLKGNNAVRQLLQFNQDSLSFKIKLLVQVS
ncbi:hypothetical protein D3C79_1090900 [compost metagenome]